MSAVTTTKTIAQCGNQLYIYLIRNVYVPAAGSGLELVPYFGDAEVPLETVNYPHLAREVAASRQGQVAPAQSASLESMFSHEESLKVLPTWKEMALVAAKFDQINKR